MIEYLQEENRFLRAQLGGKRLRFTDVQRRRLARRAHQIGRRGLAEIATLVSPDTLLRWFREIVSGRRQQPPRRMSEAAGRGASVLPESGVEVG